jgi:replication-associated recombination protein RarA
VGVYLEPRTVVNIFGPPMVGKSVLAILLANYIDYELLLTVEKDGIRVFCLGGG